MKPYAQRITSTVFALGLKIYTQSTHFIVMLSLLKLYLFSCNFAPCRHFWSVIFMSCNFMSWKLVRYFHVRNFQSTPPYLVRLLCPYATCYRALGSSASKLPQLPCTNLRFGSCSFRVPAPTLWNSLPHSVRFCESLTTLTL